MSNIKDIIAQKVNKKITPGMLKELNLSKDQLIDQLTKRVEDQVSKEKPPEASKNLSEGTIVNERHTIQDSIEMTENTTPENTEVKTEELKTEVTSYQVSADWKEDFKSMKDAIQAVHEVVSTLAETMTGLETKMKDLHETTIPSILMQLQKSGEKPEEVEEKAKPDMEEEDCYKSLQKEIEKLSTKLDVATSVATDGMKALLLNDGEDAPTNKKTVSKYWMYDRFSVDGGQQ
jgi:hypothetical protein